MDLSGLKKKYTNVYMEGPSLYAGFQRRWSRYPEDEYMTIMSAWDVFYTDENGVEHTIRPKCLYPEEVAVGTGEFTGEGTGIQMLVPFEWEAGHWYRMLVQCSESESGTTVVSQWVCDLETGEWTLMSAYDTLIEDTCFIGSAAIFLENFDVKYAGEVRAMEVSNIRIRHAKTGKWQGIESVRMGADGGFARYEGSYDCGADGNSFWMITSGVGDDWYGADKAPEPGKVYSVSEVKATSPY